MAYAMPTKAETVAEFRERYPQAGATREATLFREALRWVMDHVDARWSTSDISLTAGTAEYDLGAAVAKVESVEYHTSASSHRKLLSVSINELESEWVDWRTQTGEPQRYYIASVADGLTSETRIGLIPNPVTTTSSGYPILRIRGQYSDDLADADFVPYILGSNRAVLNRMYALYAESKFPEEAMFYHQLAEKHLSSEAVRAKQMGDEEPTRIFTYAEFRPRSRR